MQRLNWKWSAIFSPSQRKHTTTSRAEVTLRQYQEVNPTNSTRSKNIQFTVLEDMKLKLKLINCESVIKMLSLYYIYVYVN